MVSTSTKGIQRDMPPHGGINEPFKVSPNSSQDDTVPTERGRKLSKLNQLQSGLKSGLNQTGQGLKTGLNQTGQGLKNKLQAGSNMLFNLGEKDHDALKDDDSEGDAAKSYSNDQVVWYKSKGKKNKKATILEIDVGPDGQAFYTIKLNDCGREKQTDDAHLEPLGPNDAAEDDSRSRFKTGQVVFHKPGDGAPIYLVQISRVYHDGDGQPLYEISMQGSNLKKSSIRESDLLELHEVPATGTNAPAQSPSNHSRKSSRKSRSPKRGIKKTLSSEGLGKLKRGIKKASSMDGLDQMRKAVRGAGHAAGHAKATLVKAAHLPLSRHHSGLSSKDGSEEMSRQSSFRSQHSTEQRTRNPRVKKSRSMEGMREMMHTGKQHPSDGHLDGVRVRRPGVKKTNSMEGLVRTSKHGPLRKAPAPSQSMMSMNSQHSQHSGHRSVRSQRPQPRTQAEKNKLDRERGVQRSKSLEGMHPRNLRRPTSRERLGHPPNRGVEQNNSWHKEPGDRRPPARTASGDRRPPARTASGDRRPPARTASDDRARGGAPLQSATWNAAQRPIRRQQSADGKGIRRPVPPPPPKASTPPIRAVKKPAYDSDSEESSISSVSWQEPKPQSFSRTKVPPKRETPKPTEITVDMDDASAVSSSDSSWESFRERPGQRKAYDMERKRREQVVKPKLVTHDTEIIGFDCITGVEVRVQNVYSSDEDSQSSEEYEFEPEELFNWAD
ncbi:unnamed protein product [Cylindrotheca closterium]|uniref:Uncharacterized protein n=1 Tax=Cylindrotheca closterium TaxID=2856 RepID=A0AAD2FQA8_9STRA|nr:unnamed protein product [Cylindrotheca closterium]